MPLKLNKNMILPKAFENYYTQAQRDSKEYNGALLETHSVGEVFNDLVDRVMPFCDRNKLNMDEVPFFIKCNEALYLVDGVTISCSSDSAQVYFEVNEYCDKLIFELPDVRPEEDHAEYWYSRGVGGGEVSGFVKSKKAGERIKRFVNYILENDMPKSHLDYRPNQPNHIQFKFSEDEFDIAKLSQMARDNKNVLTEEIIKSCLIKHV